MFSTKNIKYLSKLNIIQTYFLNRKVQNKTIKNPIRIFRNAKIFIHKSAVISCRNGLFEFNVSYRNTEPFPGMLEMMPNSNLIFFGYIRIRAGAHIIILNNARLTLGSGSINRHCKIRCTSEISIGYNVAISENVSIWDSDMHEVRKKDNQMTKPVRIGNHVWIGTNSVILKGVTIGDNSIIAAGSIVNRDIPANCLAAGNPAKVIKENIDWR